MSHVVSIKAELKDIAAVKAACSELGLVFNENAKTIRWFGKWMNDFNGADAAFKLGITPDKYGTCNHSISVPGSNYDIGLLHNPQTGGYKIYFDFWGTDGRKLQAAIGKGGEKLVQLYGVHKATSLAKSKGYTTKRVAGPNGSIQLTVTLSN